MGPHGSEAVRAMRREERALLLGIDIGTYESKGLLVAPDGRLVASHAVPHELLLPRQGWAEHDAESVWWGDLRKLTEALLTKARANPKDILAVGCSTIAPDMLPVDEGGAPLRQAVLYGIDTRAQAEFRDQLARGEDSDGNAYARLAEGAASVPAGAEGLLVLPYFSGERTPLNDPQARGVFFGLTLSHTREHLYRAVLEGVGHGIRQHLDILETLGHVPQRLMAVGGGTRNRPWLQMVSDISGRAQTVPSVTWGAAYGDAFLAGMGAGLFHEPGEVDRWVEDRETVRPDPGLKPCYDRCHELYLELYERNRELMHTLSALAQG